MEKCDFVLRMSKKNYTKNVFSVTKIFFEEVLQMLQAALHSYWLCLATTESESPSYCKIEIWTKLWSKYSWFIFWDIRNSKSESGGGTPLYQVYRYVTPQRVWVLSRFGLKTGVDFKHFGLKMCMVNGGTFTEAYKLIFLPSNRGE